MTTLAKFGEIGSLRTLSVNVAPPPKTAGQNILYHQ